MGIKVIATKQGYYGHFREVGDEFEVEDKNAFHDSWMEKLDGKGSVNRARAIQAQTTGNNPIGASAPNRELDPLV